MPRKNSNQKLHFANAISRVLLLNGLDKTIKFKRMNRSTSKPRLRLRPKPRPKSKMKPIELFFVTLIGIATIITPLQSFSMGPKVAALGRCEAVKVVFAPGSADKAGQNDAKEFYKAVHGALDVDNTFKYNTNYSVVDSRIEQKQSDTLVEAILRKLGILQFTVTDASDGRAMPAINSVEGYAAELIEYAKTCPDTRIVLAGFGTGAVFIKGLFNYYEELEITLNQLVYVALFSDPTLYLPEGQGSYPAACRGENLSDYRMYVPDCHAYQGIQGGDEIIRFLSEKYPGKIGTWCNKNDYFCSSKFGYNDHFSYAKDGIYEDAAKVIYAKLAASYGKEREQYSAHDTAILIDTTGSMEDLIETYKAEARNLASQTLASGGRVALYEYRDLDDPFEPRELCSFKTCTSEVVFEKINGIEVDGGGDEDESLLSASKFVMEKLDWRYGVTKSLVVLTDAGYHNPDLDGVTLSDVVKLSKEIDPVNFYIITIDDELETYSSLALATDGKVVSSADELNLLTKEIMSRYDSLPRVVEESADSISTALEITNFEDLGDGAIRVFYNTGDSEIISTKEKESPEDAESGDEIDSSVSSSSPLSTSDSSSLPISDFGIFIPKAPNTGRQ